MNPQKLIVAAALVSSAPAFAKEELPQECKMPINYAIQAIEQGQSDGGNNPDNPLKLSPDFKTYSISKVKSSEPCGGVEKLKAWCFAEGGDPEILKVDVKVKDGRSKYSVTVTAVRGSCSVDEVVREEN